MKIIRIFEARGAHGLILAIALGISAGGGFASSAFAQNTREAQVIVNPDGKITYLDTRGGNYNNVAFGINDSGQVVGRSIFDGHIHVFITGPNGVGVTDLGTLGGNYSEARSINNSGQVAGTSIAADGGPHGFITGPNGVGMTDLGTEGGFGYYGINDSGQVVGQASNIVDLSWRGFITGPNGAGITDLGEKAPQGINDSGQVAGNYHVVDYDEYGNLINYGRAFITGPDGVGMTDLGTLGGLVSEASAINESGQVAGWSSVDGFSHAFITGPNGMEMTDLGTLDGFQSEANGINDSGQVVGVSYSRDGFHHAFITGPDGVGMIDLNSIADLSSGSYLSNAQGINNQGQVIATLISTIPEPASCALMLAGLGLIGFMARRNGASA